MKMVVVEQTILLISVALISIKVVLYLWRRSPHCGALWVLAVGLTNTFSGSPTQVFLGSEWEFCPARLLSHYWSSYWLCVFF